MRWLYRMTMIVLVASAAALLFRVNLCFYEGGRCRDPIGIYYAFLGLVQLVVGATILVGCVGALIRKKERVFSACTLLAAFVSFEWSSLASGIYPYERYALRRARVALGSEAFRELTGLYPERTGALHLSVLPEHKYFVVEDFVINVKDKTYGPLHKIFDYGSYYRCAGALAFARVDSLLASMPPVQDASATWRVYELMRRLHFEDAAVDTLIGGTVFTWHASAYSGEEGLVIDGGRARDDLSSRIRAHGGSRGAWAGVDTVVLLGAGAAYYRCPAYTD